MDYNGFQGRLKDLKVAEMAALRRCDKEAADRVSLPIFLVLILIDTFPIIL